MYLEEREGDSVTLGYCDNRYSVHSGLSPGSNYTVIVQADSIAPTTISKKTVLIAEQNLTCDSKLMIKLFLILQLNL